MMMVQTENQDGSAKIEELRKLIDNEDYIHDAVQRIALVLSNEILGISQGGKINEQRRKGRK